MPSCSSARRRSASVGGLMRLHERSSCEKRRGPSERSCTSSAVHFAPMISAQAATAQVVESWTWVIVGLTPELNSPASATEWGGAALDLRDCKSCDRAEPAGGRPARLGDPGDA